MTIFLDFIAGIYFPIFHFMSASPQGGDLVKRSFFVSFVCEVVSLIKLFLPIKKKRYTEPWCSIIIYMDPNVDMTSSLNR